MSGDARSCLRARTSHHGGRASAFARAGSAAIQGKLHLAADVVAAPFGGAIGEVGATTP
jgi:hypothetical protein